jgi:hypothetical protein
MIGASTNAYRLKYDKMQYIIMKANDEEAVYNPLLK